MSGAGDWVGRWAGGWVGRGTSGWVGAGAWPGAGAHGRWVAGPEGVGVGDGAAREPGLKVTKGCHLLRVQTVGMWLIGGRRVPRWQEEWWRSCHFAETPVPPRMPGTGHSIPRPVLPDGHSRHHHTTSPGPTAVTPAPGRHRAWMQGSPVRAANKHTQRRGLSPV